MKTPRKKCRKDRERFFGQRKAEKEDVLLFLFRTGTHADLF